MNGGTCGTTPAPVTTRVVQVEPVPMHFHPSMAHRKSFPLRDHLKSLKVSPIFERGPPPYNRTAVIRQVPGKESP